MDSDPPRMVEDGSPVSRPQPRPALRRLATVLSLCALAGSLIALFSMVGVGEPGESGRTCGSVFDNLVDRSGWEEWWALDLDDPDPEVRSELLRTVQCPSNINLRLALAVGLGGIAVVLGAIARGPRPDRSASDPDSLGQQLSRFGRIASFAGAALALAGVIGIVVLTADSDSTLFLYTDRIVVVVIGMVVLVPTLALFAIGRVLVLIGPHLTSLAGAEAGSKEDADREDDSRG